MVRTTTYLIEIAVGLACLAGVREGWRRSRWLGGALVVAGLAAAVHGIVALAV